MGKSKELDMFVEKVNMKLRMKYAAKELGFKPKNDVLYVKEDDCYPIYLKFDDNEICIWCSENSINKLYKTYYYIRNEVERGSCDEKGFIQNLLNKLSLGGM